MQLKLEPAPGPHLFDATDEAIDAPAHALDVALGEAKVPREKFAALKPGQVIGEVGNTGASYGTHLHIETHTGGLYQNRVDPAPWLAARGISLGC